LCAERQSLTRDAHTTQQPTESSARFHRRRCCPIASGVATACSRVIKPHKTSSWTAAHGGGTTTSNWR
jgi:hypothetical protein